jgi:proteasome lid subunit RPN8/RPN11
MSVRTVIKSGVTWSVRDEGGGREEWTRIAGNDAVGEFRVNGRGSCGIVDRPARANRSTRTRRSRPASSTSPRIANVVLTAQARQQIIEEILRFEDGPHQARESGGWLAGYFESGTLVITAAYGAGDEAAHNYGSCTLPLSRTWSVANDLRSGERVVGDFHTHSDAAAPSRADKRAWAGLSERAEAPWCGLLVARNGSDWGYPVFASYLVRGDENSIAQPELEVQRWRQ